MRKSFPCSLVRPPRSAASCPRRLHGGALAGIYLKTGRYLKVLPEDLTRLLELLALLQFLTMTMTVTVTMTMTMTAVGWEIAHLVEPLSSENCEDEREELRTRFLASVLPRLLRWRVGRRTRLGDHLSLARILLPVWPG